MSYLPKSIEEIEAATDDFAAKFPSATDPAGIDLPLALATFGLPTLETLSADPIEARSRAAHLLSHQYLRHPSPRCGACQVWPS